MAAEQMYIPSTPMRYGDSVIRGPITNWRKSLAPVMISPPTKLRLCAANWLVVLMVWPMTRSRNPGAEPLDLGDDGRSGIACVAVGHVRVGAYGMDVADRALRIG